MKVGVVGLGYWGPRLLRNLVGIVGIENVVAADRSIDRLAAACVDYPSMRAVFTLDQLLDEEGVDAVIIATPVSSHFPLVRQALEAGCHVLVEKPLAHDPRCGAELVELADRQGVVLMVGHTFLFSPRVERIATDLAEGRLGRVQYVTSARLNLGLHQSDVNVIWDLAPHDFSILFHVLDEFPVTIQTSGRGVASPGTLDVAFMNLLFESGVVASVNVSWLAPRKVRSMLIVGDRQMLHYDDSDAEEPLKLYDKGLTQPADSGFGEHQLTYRYGDVLVPHVPVKEPLAQELIHFVSAVEQDQRVLSDGRFGLRVVEALDAADRSWQLGGVPVAVERAEVGVTT